MQREAGNDLRGTGDRRHDAEGPVIVGVSSQTPGLRRTLEFAADEANRRRVDLTLVHGCSPIPMPTTLEPTTPLVDREVHWLKRLGMMAEVAAELLDPDRSVNIIVHPGTGVQALVESSARGIPGRSAAPHDIPGPPDQDRIDICPRRRALPSSCSDSQRI